MPRKLRPVVNVTLRRISNGSAPSAATIACATGPAALLSGRNTSDSLDARSCGISSACFRAPNSVASLLPVAELGPGSAAFPDVAPSAGDATC